jgi:hypothetical protein
MSGRVSSRHGFGGAWQAQVEPARLRALCRRHGSRRGPSSAVSLPRLLMALVHHFLSGPGTFAEHMCMLLGVRRSDSTLAERRAALPWALFAELLQACLRPRAQKKKHPQAFWRGWRLLALDGTTFSVSNTPQLTGAFAKAASRRLRAAFAKLNAVVLLEVGLHNPLALALGRHGESEWALALGLLAQLPKAALLLADRLYGCAAALAQVQAQCTAVGSHYLIRVRKNLKARVVQRLADGSTLLEVAVRDPKKPRQVLQWLRVREVRIRVRRAGRGAEELRLWTSLLEAKSAPALELAQLYAQRWQHELYYREMKVELRGGELLQSHTPETAAQEVAALVIATALVAQARAEAAGGAVPVLQVSFVKLLSLVRTLWLTLELGGDLLSARQGKALVARFWAQARVLLTRRRRVPRSCPRVVRQPVRGWPRKTRNQSWQGPLAFQIHAPKR